MSRVGYVIRWLAALLAFVLSVFAGFVIAGLVIRGLHIEVPYPALSVAIPVICGSLAGILTAPPAHRPIATPLFLGVAVTAFVYSALNPHPADRSAANRELALLGALVGAVVAYIAARAAWLSRGPHGSRRVNEGGITTLVFDG